ncbi:MAG: DNA polymerase III subunit delta [Oscillospiraceae bacterium]|nr:DNA polymerase III subunit delta [Oscillospiraceae bacterium]
MTEEQLLKELKSDVIRRVYYLHGKEAFLVQTYAKQIAEKALGEGDPLLNFARFTRTADLSDMADFVNALPVFAERRVALINDLDAEKLKMEELDSIVELIAGVSDSSCVIIYATGFVPDLKKVKTKKLVTAVNAHNKKATKTKPAAENAAVIEFDRLTEAAIVTRIERKAEQLGCSISRSNATHLARLCLRNYTLVSNELTKLCAYAGFVGEINRKAIDKLTTRQLDSGVFALAAEITAKRGANAMKLLDELIAQGNAPVVIMSTLSMTFIDLYRAAIASAAGKRAADIVRDFAYPPNRAWTVDKAMSAAARLPVSKIRGCVQVLCEADYKLKSSPASMSNKDRVIMERAIARLLALC